MATFTITTPVNIDSLAGKTGGDVYNINGGYLTVDQDTRYGTNGATNATMLTIAPSASIQNSNILFKGDKVRLIPFNTGAGVVPAYNTTISQGGASGLLIGVYSALNVAPTAPGAAMPTSGFIKIKQWNDVAYAAGALTGISANATGADVVGWIEIVGEEAGTLTLNRLNNTTNKLAQGAWYVVGTTDGNRSTTYQIPSNGVNQYHGGVFVQSATAISPSAISWSSGVATFTATAHGLTTGQAIVIEGASPVAYNNPTRDFVTVVDANTFTVPYTSNPGTYVSGASVVPIEFYSDTSDSALSSVVNTNERKGKFCWIATDGTLRFGHDGTNSSGGYVPPSGRKIYMGNVFMQSATAAARTQNSFNATIGTRFRLVTSAAGLVDVDKISTAWNFLNLTNCSQLSLTNSIFINRVSVANNANALTMTNVGIGQIQVEGNSILTFSACLEGGTLTNVWSGRGQWSGSNNYGIVFSNSADFTCKNLYVYGTSNRTGSQFPLFINGSNRIYVDGGAFQGRVWVSIATDVEVKNFKWWESSASSNVTNGDNVLLIATCTNGLFENIDIADGDMCSTVVAAINTNCTNVKVRNIGTYADPISTGLTAFTNATTTRSVTTATVTTASAHGLTTNNFVTVWQTDLAGITNGSKQITVTSPTTFTFVCNNTGGTTGYVSYVPGQQTSITTITNSQNIKVQNIHMLGTRSVLYTANNTNKDVYIENVTAQDNPNLNLGVAGATNLRLDSVTNTFNAGGVQSAVYGSHFISGFQYELSGPKITGTGVSWTRSGTVITVTNADHNLLTGTTIEILDGSNPQALVSGRTRSITVTGKDTFTYTGVASGSTSGTMDYITSDSRLTLQMNEPNADTASLFTVNSGTPLFTGGGTWSALTSGDQATWEMERYIIGFTGIPNMLPWWVLGGGNELNYRLQYDIDRGSGFTGTFRNWFYPEGGGSTTSGSPTVTVTSTTNIGVGDYINGQGIPNDTKVQSVDSATQITLDKNANATIGGQTFIFNYAPNEATFPSTGVKFKLRITLLAASTQPVSFVQMPLTSNATTRAVLYPQDIPDTQTVTITNGVANTRIQIYDTDANEELANEVVTTFPYTWTDPNPYVADRTIRVRASYVSGTSAKEFIEAVAGVATSSSPDVSYRLNQVDDAVYNANAINGSTVTDVVIDDATDHINLTASRTAGQIYAYEMYWLYTEAGIRDTGQRIEAIDQANYRYTNTEIKNTSSPSVPVTVSGGYIVDATTGNAIDLVDNTGGTLFLAPDHVVPFATGSGVTPSDVADIADAVWDELLSGHTTTGSAGKVLADTEDIPFI